MVKKNGNDINTAEKDLVAALEKSER